MIIRVGWKWIYLLGPFNGGFVYPLSSYKISLSFNYGTITSFKTFQKSVHHLAPNMKVLPHDDGQLIHGSDVPRPCVQIKTFSKFIDVLLLEESGLIQKIFY